MTTASPVEPVRAAEALSRALGVTVTIAEWLRRLGHGDSEQTRRYLEPKLAQLSDPSGMIDRGAAADRIASAIRANERIAVFGDYDCDGITSAAIVTESIRALGGDATPLLASRFDGGYGVSPAACDRIAKTGATLLVTCDCGSSDHVSLRLLAERGIETVVIDHHLVPEETLPAVAFLNPHRPDCRFPYKGLASCGLALSLAAAVRTALGRALDVRQWLDLVAIGTIADVAPLDGDNRALVRAGLGQIAASPRPGLSALLELTKIDRSRTPSARDVAFTIAPRLNAPGRLGSPDLSLSLLLARTEETARGIAASIEALSEQRRHVQDVMLAEAVEEIEREGYGDRAAIVIGRKGWNPGIVGIVAGRIADQFGRPVIVVGFDGDIGRGSIRGPKGARLFDAISACSALLNRFGGHQAAAGLEVTEERLPALREAFERAISDAPPAPSTDALSEAIPLARFDDPTSVVRDLERLEPCGQGNPAPRFLVSGHVMSTKELRGGHLRMELLLDGGRRLGCFGLGMGSLAATLDGTVRVLGELRRDNYRGGDAVELFVDRVVT